MKCTICDKEVNDDVKICPNCGHNFDFVYKYNDEKFHEQFDYETLNEQYEKNKHQRINSFLEKKKKEYEGITDKRERKKLDIKNIHKMIFVISLLSQLFTLFHLIAYYNDVYFDFSDSFIFSFIIGNGILLFVVSIIGFFSKKGLKYYILDFEMFYLSFFYFINIYIIFHEYVSSTVWLYIAGFIIGIVVVLRYLKKYKEDNGDLVVMGMVYVFIFIPVLMVIPLQNICKYLWGCIRQLLFFCINSYGCSSNYVLQSFSGSVNMFLQFIARIVCYAHI